MTELDLDAIEAEYKRNIPFDAQIRKHVASLIAEVRRQRAILMAMYYNSTIELLRGENDRLRAENEELRWDITRRDIDRNRMSDRGRLGGEEIT